MFSVASPFLRVVFLGRLPLQYIVRSTSLPRAFLRATQYFLDIPFGRPRSIAVRCSAFRCVDQHRPFFDAGQLSQQVLPVRRRRYTFARRTTPGPPAKAKLSDIDRPAAD